MRNIVDILACHALNKPKKIAYRFFQGTSLTPTEFDFRTLWNEAVAFATRLQSNNLENQSVLLVCQSQQNFVIAFYGCLLAGAIAVPTAPPRRANLLNRMEVLMKDANVKGMVTDLDELADFELILESEQIAVLNIATNMDSVTRSDDLAKWNVESKGADSIAFLQYTSGSTGVPKGVKVSHGNLMHNCAVIQEAMNFTENSSILTALPLFHDMGLVGGVIESMFVGCIGNCMPPTEFIKYPERWLQIISKFNITISGGPNFMYSLAAQAVSDDQIEGIDLSSWEVAFCGAEPVRSSTIEGFNKRFADYGLKSTAFYPCYGMAESTLFITGKGLDEEAKVCARDRHTIVSCGKTRQDLEVVVVDPTTKMRVQEEIEGEIWVHGPSVALGYLNKPEVNQEVFAATMVGEENKHYLRTGDLGFIKDGDLYVTGRLKDIIIINGRNYAPQDVEDAALASHRALRVAGTIALSTSDGDKEKLVVVSEIHRDWLMKVDQHDDVKKSIRKSVKTHCGIVVDDVVFIMPGTLPRTSSGKVRRAQCKADYTSNKLQKIALPA